MLDTVQDQAAATTERWLAAFEKALAAGDAVALQALFCADSHWRDLLAVTWDVDTISGASNIAAALAHRADALKAGQFAWDRTRTPPRRVVRAGTEVIEAIYRFTTVHGTCTGVLRLLDDAGAEAPQAWTLLTALDEIAGHPERVGHDRPSGESYSRDFHGPNWLDLRQAAAAFADREPAVLVVGGGQAGLSIAARLTQLGVDTLIIDRWPRIGDSWRRRYHALTLHNQVHVNHLPYLPFPPNWPTYIPKDKIAGWFEAYAEIMELNVWTGTTFAGATYDAAAQRWTARLERDDGTTRELRPRHIVMATGVSGIAHRPDLPGLDDFAGTVLHAADYDSADHWAGRRAIVIGTGNSGHDIAQDLHAHGAQVTMVQRSPTLIVGIEPSAQLPYALYDEGPDLADCDLIAAASPLAVTRKVHQMFTAQSRVFDKELLDGLERIGFKLDFGRDDTGWQFKYLERGGGYYFNVGCSDLLVNGEVGLIQFDTIERFVADGVRLDDGETLAADLVVLATGYKGQEYLVADLFGADVARRVGPIWGFDADGQELRNMWMRTGQPGLWFIAGSFAQCRIYSKYLGLQIKACEEDLIPLVRDAH